MFSDSLVLLMELLILLLGGLMIRRIVRLYRMHAAFKATATTDQADPALSAPRPVRTCSPLSVSTITLAAQTPEAPAPAPAPAPAMVLESYIDELLGHAHSTSPEEARTIVRSLPAGLPVSPSFTHHRRPVDESGTGTEPAYQPIATILSKRCDLG